MNSNVGTAAAHMARLVPSEHLRADETIKVEEKPHLLAFIRLSLIIWFIFWTIVMIALMTIPLGGIFFFIWLLLALLPVLIRYRRWRITYYALSDQRIIIGGPGKTFLSKSLVDYNIQRQMGLTDVNMTRVTGVVMEQPLGGRIFNFGTVIFNTVPTGAIKWYGVKEPARIRKLVEDIVKMFKVANIFSRSLQTTLQTRLLLNMLRSIKTGLLKVLKQFLHLQIWLLRLQAVINRIRQAT